MADVRGVGDDLAQVGEQRVIAEWLVGDGERNGVVYLGLTFLMGDRERIQLGQQFLPERQHLLAKLVCSLRTPVQFLHRLGGYDISFLRHLFVQPS